jgi:hypothetical protein
MIFFARDKTLLFLSYVYVKGTCVSTALLMQHVAIGIFGGDFGFVNVVSGHVSPCYPNSSIAASKPIISVIRFVKPSDNHHIPIS